MHSQIMVIHVNTGMHLKRMAVVPADDAQAVYGSSSCAGSSTGEASVPDPAAPVDAAALVADDAAPLDADVFPS